MSTEKVARPDRCIRQRILVRGVVQGVGFRPFVYGLAQRLGLTGLVGNESSGVFIEVQGRLESVEAFQSALREKPPPLAVIDALLAEDLAPIEEQGFTIVEGRQDARSTPVTPDVATCDECIRELFDPADRRYRYPFLNCTNCGPRFTILRDLPYDRPRTTMAVFPMCAACEAEYHDPANRRFHAQPNACPVCGPRLWFVPAAQAAEAADRPADPGDRPQGEEALHLAQEVLADGGIVAVKGLGGFHLACDATNNKAVARLRERKGRVDKPFALMIATLDLARRYVEIDSAEESLLLGGARPIVLLRRRLGLSAPRALACGVAPGNSFLGIMLPYTPLHHLLVGDRPLVMTSGNVGDEPIARDNAEALYRLAPLADSLLVHNREIHVVCDDSVVRVFEGHEAPVRRSRGYAPFPVPWPAADGPAVLATGGELKATACLAKPPYAYLSQHIGDMGNLETLDAFERALEHLRLLFRADPALVACDTHPGYLSVQWARRFADERGLPLVQVQHHHAHAASVMMEHGLDGSKPVVAIVFDGTGHGPDQAIWGGEVLLADYRGFRRLAHLKYVPLPGGDAAIRRPYRVALAHLWAAGLPWADDLPCVAACPQIERRLLRRQLERSAQCVPTSSMGRLFDAVSALIGIRQIVTYEAQAAIEMESLCHRGDERAEVSFAWDLEEGSDPLVFSPTAILSRIVSEQSRGASREALAFYLHLAVADLIIELARRARQQTNVATVALSGGVFQNMLLLRLAVDRLRAGGFDVLVHRKVPANDGGLALGQAAVAWGMAMSGRWF
jgi:hydrogenase maturation protein HypF